MTDTFQAAWPAGARLPGPRAAEEAVVLRRRILVADENGASRQQLQQWLQAERGLAAEIDVADGGAEAVEALHARNYSLVIADGQVTCPDGTHLVHILQQRGQPVAVIVLTARANIGEAVDAMRRGAYDVLTRPIEPRRLLTSVRRALGERVWQDEVAYLCEHLQGRFAFHDIISKSRSMHAVFELIRRVGPSTATVLIEGETGTGKELVARALHRLSPRRDGPMVAINCASLPEHLLESELFGHEKGAFTSAVGQRRGRFELAHGGTIFLDEVGDIAPAVQAKLLRVLQEHHFERLGGAETIQTDVRVVAATNRSLKQLVQDDTFREDLYYRLNVVKIDLPPLRDRPEDIPLLATHFARKYARPGESPKQIDPGVMKVLLSYRWPGNVRELENAIERACVVSRGNFIQPGALPPELGTGSLSGLPVPIDLDRSLPQLQREVIADIEAQYIRRALEQSRGNLVRCAKICGLSRRTLFDKLTQYKIDKSAFKGA